VKKEQNGRKSLRRIKPTVGCNASKRIRRRRSSSSSSILIPVLILLPSFRVCITDANVSFSS
jgi:hypothetical protein